MAGDGKILGKAGEDVRVNTVQLARSVSVSLLHKPLSHLPHSVNYYLKCGKCTPVYQRYEINHVSSISHDADGEQTAPLSQAKGTTADLLSVSYI